MHPLQEAYEEMFRRVPQEVMVTLRFENSRVDANLVYRQLIEFVRLIAKHYKTRIFGFAVFNCLRHPHMHLLLAGHTVNLRDLPTQTVERLWAFGSAFAKPCRDSGAALYLALNITPHADDKWEEFPIGIRLLKKYGVPKNNLKTSKNTI